MSALKLAIEHILFARRYTVGLLSDVDPADWFRMPSEGVTHVAWQVGHLAFAEYRLVLERVRGVRPADAALLPPAYFPLFGRDSTPDPDPAKYPSASEIRAVFDRVHEQVLHDLAGHPEADLDAPVLTPHRLTKTKREVLSWCSHHEMVHAGQIALLRRLLGRRPQW
jgi:DinB superfamily